MNDPTPSIPPAEPSDSSGDSSRPSIWRSEELLGAADEVMIQHGEDFYRLRRTRRGKLILYK